MPTDHIESFEQKKINIVEELKALKTEINTYVTEQTPPADANLTPAQETEKVQKLNAKVTELKTRLEQDVQRWKDTLGAENEPALAAIDAFWQEMQQKIEVIDKTTIGGLLSGLDALKQRVEAAEDNAAGTTAEIILGADKEPQVKDIIVEMEEEEQSGLGGMIAKLSKMMKPMMKIFSGLMIELKKIGLSMNPFASEESRQQARAELEQMQEAYEQTYGMDNLRGLFTGQAEKLGFGNLVFKPGMRDGKAVTKFKQQYLAYRGIDTSKTKEKYVQELLKEYVEGDQIVTASDLAGKEHFITMQGFLEGEKPQVV